MRGNMHSGMTHSCRAREALPARRRLPACLCTSVWQSRGRSSPRGRACALPRAPRAGIRLPYVAATQFARCSAVLGCMGRRQSLNSQRCELAAPAVISLIRRMLTTGELARREASSSDPERLVAFSRHNHLACDQSSGFWPLPASTTLTYSRLLLASTLC